MPKKYIDADKIHDVIASHFCACSDETEAALHSVWEELKAIPGENVVEVRRGRWVQWSTYFGDMARCSICKHEMNVNEPGNGLENVEDLHFCPNCGALMEDA